MKATVRPVAASMPARTAAPLPRLTGWRDDLVGPGGLGRVGGVVAGPVVDHHDLEAAVVRRPRRGPCAGGVTVSPMRSSRKAGHHDRSGGRRPGAGGRSPARYRRRRCGTRSRRATAAHAEARCAPRRGQLPPGRSSVHVPPARSYGAVARPHRRPNASGRTSAGRGERGIGPVGHAAARRPPAHRVSAVTGRRDGREEPGLRGSRVAARIAAPGPSWSTPVHHRPGPGGDRDPRQRRRRRPGARRARRVAGRGGSARPQNRVGGGHVDGGRPAASHTRPASPTSVRRSPARSIDRSQP